MFSEPDLDTMQLVRCAFDPDNIANPDKVFPRTRLCADQSRPLRPASARNRRHRGDTSSDYCQT